MLDRCRASGTCPKITEIFSAAEFWNLRMSPGHIGTRADVDIPLPPEVRRYYVPSTSHGGGNGAFTLAPAATGSTLGTCVLPANPMPAAEILRALTAATLEWVTKGREMPPSSIRSSPTARSFTKRSFNYPAIPGKPSPIGLVNTIIDYDYGTNFIYNDMSGYITDAPIVVKQLIPTYVPQVDTDGNEIAGVKPLLGQLPLGTYTGWNITANGFYKGQACAFTGGFIPFAKTKAERLANNDPRPSLEERYGNIYGYYWEANTIVNRMVQERYLLAADANRLINMLLNQIIANDLLPRRAGFPRSSATDRTRHRFVRMHVPRFRSMLTGVLALALAGGAYADYPDKQFTFVVPFAAGSATDQLARSLGQEVTRITKQAVIVDNKPGASGFIGAEAAKKAAPDGYTVFITTNTTHAANEHLFKKIPYDPMKDYLPVTGLGKGGQIMIVNLNTPAKSVAEFIALAKSQPGKISFGSGSSSSRVAGEMFQQLAGVELLHVPYKSNPLAINDLLGGQINMMITDTATGLPQVKGGKVRALAVSTAKRSPLDTRPSHHRRSRREGLRHGLLVRGVRAGEHAARGRQQAARHPGRSHQGSRDAAVLQHGRHRSVRHDTRRARQVPGGRVGEMEEHHQEGRN